MKFPGAPADATYTDEGWLCIGDEAWTEHEWSLLSPLQRRAVTGDAPLDDETERDRKLRQARIRSRRRRAHG